MKKLIDMLHESGITGVISLSDSRMDALKAFEALVRADEREQRKPLTLGQKQRLWSKVGEKTSLKDRVNAFGLEIEAAHGIRARGNT